MGNFFRVDGKLYQFMQTLTDVFIISILWILCSIPIFTLGPATVAGFSVTLKISDEREGYVGRQFLRAFRENFKHSIPYSFIVLIGGYIVWLDFSLFNQLENGPILLLIAGFVAGFIYYFCLLYAFALEARYKNTVIKTLKNSFSIATRFWLRSLSLTFFLVLELLIIFWNQITMFIGLLVGPGCIMLTISGYANYIFRTLEKEPGSIENPENP